MRADFLILADRGYVDEDGKVNVEGVGITHVRVEEFPASVGRLVAVARLLADEDDQFREAPVEVVIRLFRPDRSLAAETEPLRIPPADLEQPQVHPGEERSYFWLVDMPGLTFNAPGLFRFTLVLEGKTAAERPLVVFEAAPGEDAPAATEGASRSPEIAHDDA